MKFYIVTPTYNALSWLQRCIRSVADQVTEEVEIHHHVQDGGSTDGTPAWLQQWQASCTAFPGYTLTYESCADSGMYDALNKAWEKIPSDADVTAHLNSDEQYLPSALKHVAMVFDRHSTADIVATAFIIVDAEGRYICHRRSVPATRFCSQVACELNTCSCFHKVTSFIRHGIRFDIRYRIIADMVMYRELMNYGVNVKSCPDLITSIFSVTGSNLAWVNHRDAAETELADKEVSPAMLRFRLPIIRWSNMLRRLCDVFCSVPRAYSLYLADDSQRTEKRIKHPTAAWGMRFHAVDED